MSHCCASSNVSRAPGKYKCPVNGKQYTGVSSATVMHHINEPWKWHNKQQGYYFCDDPECDVVYFGEDDSIINKAALRTIVGIKEKSDDSLVCYCFGITRQIAANQQVKEFVIKNTKEHTCACTARNPSGRCCLKDFP